MSRETRPCAGERGQAAGLTADRRAPAVARCRLRFPSRRSDTRVAAEQLGRMYRARPEPLPHWEAADSAWGKHKSSHPQQNAPGNSGCRGDSLPSAGFTSGSCCWVVPQAIAGCSAFPLELPRARALTPVQASPPTRGAVRRSGHRPEGHALIRFRSWPRNRVRFPPRRCPCHKPGRRGRSGNSMRSWMSRGACCSEPAMLPEFRRVWRRTHQTVQRRPASSRCRCRG